MSAFLSSTRPTQNERDAEKAAAYQRWAAAKSCYKWATFLVVVAMIVIAMPQLGVGQWNWHIVGGTGALVSLLAVVMMLKGTVNNGVISLIFAWAILPGWIYAAPRVVEVAKAQYEVIAKEWRRTMGKPAPVQKAESKDGKGAVDGR